MKKQELVHLHGFGKAINDWLAKGGNNLEPRDDFSETPESFSGQGAPEYLEQYNDLGCTIPLYTKAKKITRQLSLNCSLQ